MGQENVFNENVEYLKAAKEDLDNLDKMKKALETLKADDKRLRREIAAEDKSISDEIAVTLRRRKEEISDTYDKQLEITQDKVKRLLAKRDKKKNKKINERVNIETADIIEENRALTTEMRTLFKKDGVPRFCNSNLYYALFMTKGIVESIKLILGIIITLFALPTLVSYIGSISFLEQSKDATLYYGIIYIVFILLTFTVYVTLMNTTKVKHRDLLMEGRKIKDQIKANNKQIKAIRNSIQKDKDESGYGLDDYDKRLKDIEAEAVKAVNDKQAALTLFENDTKNLLIHEINGRRLPALELLKEELKDTENKYSIGEDAISEMNIIISNKYETYLGKEFIRMDKLIDLITIMEEGDANTVSAAIAFYKGDKQA